MKIKKLRYIDKLESLNVSKNDMVIYGSAPLVLRGLKGKNSDLDVLVKDDLWNKLKVDYPNNINGDFIDIDGVSFTHRSSDFFESMDSIMQKSDIIDGYHVMNLEETVKWKEKVGTEKHIEDAKLIKDYLGKLESRL